MLTAHQENERTLARLVGISEEEAAQRLAFKVRVRVCDSASQDFASHLRALLGFTLHVVGAGEPADLELAINGEPSGDTPVALVVRIDDRGMRIVQDVAEIGANPAAPPHDLCAKLAAC